MENKETFENAKNVLRKHLEENKEKVVADLIEMHEKSNKRDNVEEELEKAATKYATNWGMMSYVFPEKRAAFIDGAKWKEKRMFTIEDLKDCFTESRKAKIFEKGMPPVHENFEDWFKIFENKDKKFT